MKLSMMTWLLVGVLAITSTLTADAVASVKQVEALHNLRNESEVRALVEVERKKVPLADPYILLWGRMLGDRLRGKAESTGSSTGIAGWIVIGAEGEAADPDLWSLMAWWTDTVMDGYIPRPVTVTEPDGKKRSGGFVPEPLFSKLRSALQDRLVANDGGDFSKMLRWWYQARPKEGRRVRPVSDAEIAAIANNPKSPWRLFALAEMAWRERRRKQEGPWTQRWAAIKARTPQNVAVQALVKEERYLIEKGRL